MAAAYDTDLTDQQWLLIQGLLPTPKFGGRPRTTNVRRVIDGILYLLKTGCQWPQLPNDFPPGSRSMRPGLSPASPGSGRAGRCDRKLAKRHRFLNKIATNPFERDAPVITSPAVATLDAGI
jgi:hypothetical protein